MSDASKTGRDEVDEVQRWNDVSRAARLPEGIVLQLFVPKTVDLRGAFVLPRETVAAAVSVLAAGGEAAQVFP